MANLVKIDRANTNGAKVLNALEKIREGIGILKQIDGQRAQAIAVSVTEFDTMFGVTSANGNELSDRIAAFLAFHDIQWGETGYDYTAKLRDLIDAVFSQ